MNDLRPHLRPAPVRAIDDESRRFVRPGNALDDATMRLHEGSTEPERSFDASVLELRSRDPERLWLPRAVVDDALRDASERKHAPAPIDLRAEEPPTVPDPSERPSSDVFQPLVPEPPTPRDRPLRIDERATELEDRRAAVTATYHATRNIPLREEEPGDAARDRSALATAHERTLVESMYASQRRFLVIESEAPQRAAHITSLAGALKTSDVFTARERVLAIHARQRIALEQAPSADRRQDREDQVLAIALVARELDDKYRDTMRTLRDQLVKELPSLPEDKQKAVFADFDSFIEKGGANDSHFCRRELDNALNNEVVLHRAYVYALALVQPKLQPEVNAADLILDDEPRKAGG